MRGHPAITVCVFLTGDGGGAGIWPAVCRPTRHHDGHPAAIAHWFSTRMVGRGRHVFRCVLSRARAHLAHSARAPNVAHLARLEHAAHLAHVEHVAHLAHQACLARLGPSVAHMGSDLVPSSCPSKEDGR